MFILCVRAEQTCHVDVVPVGTRRGHHIIRDWSYRWLLVAMWVQEIEPRSS